MRIGVDLDGVVFDFNGHFTKFVNNKFKKNIIIPNQFDWDWLITNGHITKEEYHEAFEYFILSGEFRHLPLIEESVYYLSKLFQEGHNICFITSRDTRTRAATDVALFNAGLQEFEVYFSDRMTTKADLCRLHAINLFVEDNTHYINEVIKDCPSTKVIYFNHNNRLIHVPETNNYTLAYNWKTLYENYKN